MSTKMESIIRKLAPGDQQTDTLNPIINVARQLMMNSDSESESEDSGSKTDTDSNE